MKHHEDELRELIGRFEQAIWNLANEHECGWNQDNCRPQMEQDIEDRRQAIVDYTMRGIIR